MRKLRSEKQRGSIRADEDLMFVAREAHDKVPALVQGAWFAINETTPRRCELTQPVPLPSVVSLDIRSATDPLC